MVSDPNTPAGIDHDSELEIPPIDDDNELGGEDTVAANDQLDGEVER